MTKRGSLGFLQSEKAGRRHRAGEDVFFDHVDSESSQFGDDVAASALAVVGQETKRNVARSQFVDKGIRAGNQVMAAIQNARPCRSSIRVSWEPLHSVMGESGRGFRD